MFHVVYSRHYWDYEDGNGTFDNSWTVLRNVPYDKLNEFTKEKLAEKKVECDAYYKMYDENRFTYDEMQIDKDQCFTTECFIVDDADYFRTYQDEYGYHLGAMDPDKDYINNYGQDCEFMVQKDYGRA